MKAIDQEKKKHKKMPPKAMLEYEEGWGTS